MNMEMQNCYELVKQSKDLSVKRFDELLINKSEEACKEFILGFLKYVYSITSKVYELNKEEFNAYYDYEEFFNDGILLAIRLYNYMDYAKRNKPNCFSTYCKYYHYLIMHQLSKTYCVKASHATIDKIKLVKKIRKQLLEKNKREPSIELISKLTGFDSKIIKKAYLFIDFEYPFVDSYDDEHLINVESHYDLSRALNEISVAKRDTVCQLSGFSMDDDVVFPKTMSEIADEKNVSRQSVWDISHRAYKVLRKSLYLNGYDD